MTDAVREPFPENPKLSGVVDIVDFNATTAGQRIITDDKLKLLVDVLGKHRLGLDDVEPDILGRAYEYLLRKFAEGSGSSAGEFYTPREVAVLIAHLIDPRPGETIYDPACGSGGLLIKSHLRFIEKYGSDLRPALVLKKQKKEK
jgi:type I restriction enzyme M protein